MLLIMETFLFFNRSGGLVENGKFSNRILKGKRKFSILPFQIYEQNLVIE